MISKDIEELVKEKLSLEQDIAQKEADIKIKSGEIKSLQVSDWSCFLKDFRSDLMLVLLRVNWTH